MQKYKAQKLPQNLWQNIEMENGENMRLRDPVLKYPDREWTAHAVLYILKNKWKITVYNCARLKLERRL